jgi:tetratricopeptide (TPR) repeat protein
VDASTDSVPAEPPRHRVREEQYAIDRLWDFSDPALSESRFREAADDVESTAHIRAAMATQLARAIGIQGRVDDALAVLDAVEDGARRAANGEVADVELADAELAEVRARVALERGRILVAAERESEAVPALTRAVREAAHAGSAFLALDAVHMLALTDTGHEREWAEQGFELLAADRDPRVLRWGVALHNNLGWALLDLGDATEALAQFELAVDAADHYGTAEQQHVTRWSVGRALRAVGRTDEALTLQRELARARPEDPYVAAEIEALTEGEPTIEA